MIVTVTLNAAIDKRYVVEDYQKGEVNRVKSCEATAGGKGLNVSKPIHIAGFPVIATGIVGGSAGDYITSTLDKMGVTNDFYKVKEESRTCINIWDEKHREQTEFLEPGFDLQEADFEKFVEKYKQLLEKASVVDMSGSIPKGLNESAYPRLIRLAKEKGIPVILDSSGKLLEEGIKEKPFLIKPNIDEIRMLTKKDCKTYKELCSAGEDLYNRGIENVVISLGSEGALLFSKEGNYKTCIPKINAVNTVGCGDAMIAGFAIGIHRGWPMKECLRYASGISVSAALREETGYFEKSDFEKILPQIKVEKI